MSAWVPQKTPDGERVTELLRASTDANHFANGGPCVRRLEAFLRADVIQPAETDDGADPWTVVATCSGAAAMHALMAAWCVKANSHLSFVTQAFTFPVSAQGAVAHHVAIVDLDPAHGGPLLREGDATHEAVIVTNAFGRCADLKHYVDWCQRHHALLLLDNAATPYTWYGGRNSCLVGNGSIISLHHTKPFGFGEGGAVVCRRSLEPYVRRMINFGYDGTGAHGWHPLATNGKMSDVAAAYALAFLTSRRGSPRALLAASDDVHQRMWERLGHLIAHCMPSAALMDMAGRQGVRSCVVLMFEDAAASERCIATCERLGLVARRYYKPLAGRDVVPHAWHVYDRIVCLPCHADVTDVDMERIREAVQEAVRA